MAQQTAEAKREKGPMSGVDTPTLFATINAVRDQPELAKFQFRASSRWLEGTHSRSQVEAFTGAGGTHTHESQYGFDADHPKVLVGGGQGPTPVEFLLHGLAGCLTAGIANVAAARGVRLTEVESTVEGDLNLLGILGISNEVRNGYEKVRVNFKIKGDAPAEKLQEIVEQSRNRSAVYDVMTQGTPIEVNVEAA
ncbi:MAG: OsmC family protein [Planctomycetota bacterium]